MRTAIVTPYYQEPQEVLARCIASVKQQTAAVDHILIADGHPQPWVPKMGVRQIALDCSHGDYGDSPRAIGFMLAVREQYDAIQFLDADNVLDNNHVETMWRVQQRESLDVVAATRYFLRPDGSHLPFRCVEEEEGVHVDTNCYFFTRPAFNVGLKWGLVPKQMGCIGDRIFFLMMRASGLSISRVVEPTVGYTSMWSVTYEAVGEVPPSGAKTLDDAEQKMMAWWHALPYAEKSNIQKTLGLTINW